MKWFENLHPNKFAAFADGFLTAAVIGYCIYISRKDV